MFTEEDKKWMEKALELAEAAAKNGEVPIGAVIVQNGAQIGAGQNRMEELKSAAAHAEILAINEAGKTINNWRLDGATIYVSLEPCPMCLAAIKNARISRVVFATHTGQTRGSAPTICVENGLMQKESAEILKKFFQEVRTVKGDSGRKL